VSYQQEYLQYRFIDGYSRSAFRGTPQQSARLVSGMHDAMTTTGGGHNPRLGGGRLSPRSQFSTMSYPRATRFGGGRLGQRSRFTKHRGAMALRFGQFDVVGEGLQDVASIVGALGGPPDGSSSDPRIIDLNNAYNQAIAGNNTSGSNPTGIPYIQAWIADQPPHPTYSNQYAQQLLTMLQSAAKTGATLAPATSNTSPSSPPAVVSSGSVLTGTIAGVPTWAWLVGGAGVLWFATRK
jgi:hypothetical protein